MTPSTAGFTKGPWHGEEMRAPNGGTYYRVFRESDRDNTTAQPIAQVIGHCLEARQNVAVIIAAPDMYAALDDCPLPSQSAPSGEFYGRFYDWYNGQRTAALSKAVKP